MEWRKLYREEREKCNLAVQLIQMKLIPGFVLLLSLFSCAGKTTNGKTIVVDVRPEGIWKQGHGKSINIPLPELEKHRSELLQYDTVIFVCETGESAQNATSWMNVNAPKDHETIFTNGSSWTNYN